MGIEIPRRSVNRRFFVILALSLLLHGSLLFWQMAARKQAPVLPTLIATLRLTAVPSPSEPLRAAATVTQVTRPVPRVQPKVRPSSARPVVAPPRERITTAAPTPETIPAAQPLTPVAVAPAAAPAPAALPPALASALAAAPAAELANQRDLLAAYRRQLGELFSRHQSYPRIAALRGWEGEVRVRLKVARKGSLIGVQLDRSSGFDVLDRHALAMLGDLPGLPALPDGFSSDELQLVVPILYKLNKTT